MSDDDELYPSPSRNTDLIGHEDAEQTLLEAFNGPRMHHAWMLCGPRGIGKATLAYRFARFVLSQPNDAGGSMFDDALPQAKPDSLSVPESHPTFQRIAAGGHSDMVTLERRADPKTGKMKSEIIIDDVRKTLHFLNLTAAEGGWRVCLIDSVDEMNRNAANAVLKALEEPPPRTVMLLVSHNPGRLLPTIKSRCRKLNLRPLENDVVSKLLLRYNPVVDPMGAAELARMADGSIGKALDLADLGGLELYEQMLVLLGTLPSLDIPALHILGDTVGRAGADDAFRTLTDLLRWWLGRLILVASGKGAGTGSDAELLTKLAHSAPLDRWFAVWEKINTLVQRTGAVNLDRKQVLLDIFLSIETTVRTAR